MTSSGSSRKVVHMLTNDLIETYIQSARKLKALTKTFGFKNMRIPDFNTALKNGSVTTNREKR